jgi:hypothetical protein
MNSRLCRLNQNKSRRKSCQACAESKVKCDLKQPCTKCTSRGKECIFINDPAQSREKKAAAAARRKATQKAAADAHSNSSASPRLTPSSCNTMLYPSAYSYDLELEQDTEISLVTEINSTSSTFDISPISPTELLYKPSYSGPYPELSTGSTTTSSSMSPRSDIFEIAADYYAAGPEIHMLDESLAKIIPQDMVPLYPETSFAMQSHDFVQTSQGLLDFGYETQPQWMIDSVLTACPPLDVDAYITPLAGDSTSTSMDLSSSLLVARETSPIDLSPKESSVGPAEAELQHYCERYGCFLSPLGASAADTRSQYFYFTPRSNHTCLSSIPQPGRWKGRRLSWAERRRHVVPSLSRLELRGTSSLRLFKTPAKASFKRWV